MNDYLPANIYQATSDVGPDGRFVMSKRLTSAAGSGFEQLIVVENFLADLRRTIR